MAFSARPEDIQSVSYDATHKETTINFTGVFPPITLDGMEVRVAVPGDITKRYRTARVQHSGGGSPALRNRLTLGYETASKREE